MATTVGNDGVVQIGTSNVAEVTAWSYDEVVDELEDTAMGDTGKTFKGGLKDGTGQITCWWDGTDTNGQNAMTTGASVTLSLMPEGSTTGNIEYSGSVTITGLSISGDKNGIVTAVFSYHGMLTKGTV